MGFILSRNIGDGLCLRHGIFIDEGGEQNMIAVILMVVIAIVFLAVFSYLITHQAHK